MAEQENDQILQRRLHLEQIVELGQAAYPHRFDRTHPISELVGQYLPLAGRKEGEELESLNQQLRQAEGGEIRLAGRVQTMRLMGKALFA
ncbi:MAG: hypothetical protein ACO394_09305, partial [Blastocatellia bacterium]